MLKLKKEMSGIMERLYGVVKEVYIPLEYNDNNNLLDVMDRHNIGFKIDVDGEVESYEFEQDEFNCQILKNDFVMITKQTIDGTNFIDIEKVESDLNE